MHNLKHIELEMESKTEYPGNILKLKGVNHVDHPPHYCAHPAGIEAIQVCEHMTFNIGSAMKYLFRYQLKGRPKQDLEKAVWYVRREIKRMPTS